MLLGFGSKSLVQTPVETPEVTTLITYSQFAIIIMVNGQIASPWREDTNGLFCNDVSPSMLQLIRSCVVPQKSEPAHRLELLLHSPNIIVSDFIILEAAFSELHVCLPGGVVPPLLPLENYTECVDSTPPRPPTRTRVTIDFKCYRTLHFVSYSDDVSKFKINQKILYFNANFEQKQLFR